MLVGGVGEVVGIHTVRRVVALVAVETEVYSILLIPLMVILIKAEVVEEDNLTILFNLEKVVLV
jgi:hypothetical protein